MAISWFAIVVAAIQNLILTVSIEQGLVSCGHEIVLKVTISTSCPTYVEMLGIHHRSNNTVSKLWGFVLIQKFCVVIRPVYLRIMRAGSAQ